MTPLRTEMKGSSPVMDIKMILMTSEGRKAVATSGFSFRNLEIY